MTRPSLRELLSLCERTYADGRRPRNSAWTCRGELGEGQGYRALLWTHPARSAAVVSVRGTASHREVVGDLRLLCGREPTAWQRLADSLPGLRKFLGDDAALVLTGHSLGGAFASTVGAAHGVQTVTFNAPGMRRALQRSRRACEAQWLFEDHPNVIEIGLRSDWISELSGPVLGRRIALGPAPNLRLRGTGPHALADMLLRGLMRRGGAFIAESLRRHGVTSLRPWASSGCLASDAGALHYVASRARYGPIVARMPFESPVPSTQAWA